MNIEYEIFERLTEDREPSGRYNVFRNSFGWQPVFPEDFVSYEAAQEALAELVGDEAIQLPEHLRPRGQSDN